ncbi:SseB family protein [Labedella populi]|uniref:SseB family protein n=1 Tax=Labedella populi TaxID=2498850 RepID=A0A3S3ZF66_9MICO|nr:SseB family protein [Labedella populi]RWZ55419.1 SseB family protein [Labedella populi]
MSPGTEPADSAGRPWANRSFGHHDTAHAGDDGSAPPELLDVLERFRTGAASQSDVVDVIRSARFLIPLVAEAGGVEENAEGLRVEKTQELSIVSVAGPDGRAVLPVFSSVTAMSAWNSDARPVPADGTRVALAAASEDTELVVVDPGSETEFVVRRPALWSVARNEPWTSAPDDPEVFAAFDASISTELGVIAVRVNHGDPDARLRAPEVQVVLELVAGLTRAELDQILERLARRWAADEVIATRVDSLAVKLTTSE